MSTEFFVFMLFIGIPIFFGLLFLCDWIIGKLIK